MRAIASFLLLSGVFFHLALRSYGQSTQSPQNQVHMEDGGMREVLESIAVPPMASSPFTATLETAWVRHVADGGTITLVNQRRIARDANGRIYEERWFLVPKNGRIESRMSHIQIADPNAHTLYTCRMDSRHICDLTTYTATTTMVFKMDGPPAGPLADGTGYRTVENLGNQVIAGVDTVGTRETTTYNPGVFGNDQKVTATREYWYSSQLGISPLSKRSEPLAGTQTFTIADITLSEPEAQLFELPEGFKVVDRRATAPPTLNLN